MKQLRTLALAVLILSISLITNAQKRKWKMYGHTFPEPNSEFSISVIHDSRSHWTLGVGWQRTINPQIILTSYKDWYKDSVFLKVNLDSITAKLIRGKVKEPLSFRSNIVAKNNILTVRPIAFITPELNNYDSHRPLNHYALIYYTLSFQIETIFSDAKGSKIWKAQYFYTVPDDKPLFGKESLTTNDGELLRRWAERGLEKCIEALFIDLKGSSAKWKNDTVIPEELKAMPKGSLFEWPEGTAVLQETSDDWVVRQPIIFFGNPTGGFIVTIISKDKNRLLTHLIGRK